MIKIFNKRKKGSVVVISLFFIVLLFIILWVTTLASMFSEWGNKAVQEHNLTGINAFIMQNLNLVILLFLILAIIVAVSYTHLTLPTKRIV